MIMKTNRIFLSAIALGVTIVAFNACNNDDNNNGLPPIGGYDNADEVGSADLVAHWPLDGNSEERISGTDASNEVNTTWVTAVKGEGADFNLGYLNYPVIPALNAINNSITVSCWAKVANNQENATMLFSLTKPIDATHNEWNGAANVLVETGRGNRLPITDTLQVKGLFNILKPTGESFGGDAVNAEQLTPDDIAAGGQVHVNLTAMEWMHVVYTYDGTTAINKLYVNGVKISNPQWEERNKIGGVNVGVPFNANAAAHAVIGTFGTILTGNADSWQNSMRGQMDEVRVWKKILTQAEITSLYELEKAGR
jgi:hypothetical protein